MLVQRNQKRFHLVLLLPPLLLYTLWVVLPAFQAFYYALTKWDGLSSPIFIGLANFMTMLTDKNVFLVALKNNAILITIPSILILLIALFFAYLLHREIRGSNIFRIIFYFPNVMSLVAIALLWMLIYSTTSFGVLNHIRRVLFNFARNHFHAFLPLANIALATIAAALIVVLIIRKILKKLFNLSSKPALMNIISFAAVVAIAVAVLIISITGPLKNYIAAHSITPGSEFEPYGYTSSAILVRSLIPMIVWTATGFYMLLFLAAMQSVPKTLYEAASIDGATEGGKFMHVTLPMIWEVFVTGLIFLIIAGLKIFEPIWIMEQQLARVDSNTIATLMYSKIFSEYRVGYGTAVAVFLFILVLLFTSFTRKMTRRERLEY